MAPSDCAYGVNLDSPLAWMAKRETHDVSHQGIDELLFGALNARALLSAMEAAEGHPLLDSSIWQMFLVGATYSIALNAGKLTDHVGDTISLYRFWIKFVSPKKGMDIEEKLVTTIFQNHKKNDQQTILTPIKRFRDKALAHNESVVPITFDEIDHSLRFLVRVWALSQRYVTPLTTIPTCRLPFFSCSKNMDRIFDRACLQLMETAWDASWDDVDEWLKTPVNLMVLPGPHP